jgi:energy-coupling factor transporter ATP-binding protein EcfA2
VPVTREHVLSATAAPTGVAEVGNLPAPFTRIVGRDDVIVALATQLARRRFLTIVGPGGIGKTTVAVAVAGAVRASYKDGAWFVGLASLSNPQLVPSALGAALGMLPSGANPVQGLSAWLRDQTALIVLDSCEHVVGKAATLAEAVLKAAPGVSILTTSQEPLRAEGETLGDSVSGNMAAALTLTARQRRGPKIAFQVLFYPVTDAGFDMASYTRFADGPWLNKRAMQWFWDAYLPDPAARK